MLQMLVYFVNLQVFDKQVVILYILQIINIYTNK